MGKAKQEKELGKESLEAAMEDKELENSEDNLKIVEDQTEQESQEEVEEEDELSKSQRELAEMKDKYLRLYSEFENFRRRTSREKLDLIVTANEGLILSMLPVVDDFERGIVHSKESDIKSVKEGINLIFNKLQSVLLQKGVKVMDTKKGSVFDTELHEAITQIPAPSKKLKGKIIDTIENGYSIGDKVIRHAKVVIGN